MRALSAQRETFFDDRYLGWAVLASLLLHVLLAGLLLAEPWSWKIKPPDEPQFSMVFPETPKAPPPKPAETPKAEDALKPPPPQAAPPPVALPPPPVPQLQRAPIAEESKAPPSPGAKARSQPQAAPAQKPVEQPPPAGVGPRQVPQLNGPAQKRAETGNKQAGAGQAAGPAGTTMTQSESDFFLGQVVAAWVIDFDSPKFRDIQIYGHYKVLPNGMLAPPFGKNDPWDIHAMVNNWDEIARIPEAAAFRTAIETFLRAMRLAQPFRMPPDTSGYPKVMQLNFRIGDL